MTSVYRLPGGWDQLYSNKHTNFHNVSLQDDISDVQSLARSENNLYNDFINMAQKKTVSKKQEPLTVEIQGVNSGANTYQFPYEITSTWEKFQESLIKAFPRYKKIIEKGNMTLVSKEDDSFFLPLHFDVFIHPGMHIIIHFKRSNLEQTREPRRKKQAQYTLEDEEEEEEELEFEEDEEDSQKQTKKSIPRAKRMINWLTE